MATIEEIQAKMAKAEAAGDAAAVSAFRSRLAILKAAPHEIMGKIEKAKAAGDAPAVAALTDALKINSEFIEEQFAASVAQPPPRADAAGVDEKIYTDGRVEKATAETIAKIEGQNPSLKGRFKPGDNIPAVGSPTGLMTFTSKSGARAVTVAEWRQGKIDTFGDTARSVMEGPISGVKAFGAGIVDSSQSPSMAFMNQDPATKGLPNWVKVPISKVTDVAGAGLSAIGAGIAGAVGLGAEVVPGLDPASERKLAQDTIEMSQFAVPELAGVSSVPARAAGIAPKVAAGITELSSVEKAVAGAKRFGIPVMRTDVKPPQSFIGKAIRKTGESIPIAGTGGMRVRQQAARTQAVKDFVTEYGDPGAVEAVSAAVRKSDAERVQRLYSQKDAVISSIPGAVSTPKAVAAIDAQIAKLKSGLSEVSNAIVPILEQWKSDLKGKTLKEIELIRKQVGERFTAMDGTTGRKSGESAVSAIYGPLREDMGDFIKKFGKPSDFMKWKTANTKLAESIGEAQTSALKAVLRDGESTPEMVERLLFSQKPSEIKRLQDILPRGARANARAAIIQRALKSSVNDIADIENISVQKFNTALERMGASARAFMDPEDLEATEGLVKALRLTQRAGEAGVMTNTGAQTLPIVLTAFLTDLFGTAGGALGGGVTLGMFSRWYEATGVNRALRRLAKVRDPRAEKSALKMLDEALSAIAAPTAGQAANTEPPMAVGQN